MKRSNRLMLMLGVVLAVVAFGGVMIFGSPPGSAKPVEAETVPVVMAATDIELGTSLAVEQLTTVQRPVTEAVETFRDPSDVVGEVVRRPVAAGEALRPTDFAPSSAGAATQVAESLDAGQRAIAVPVDMISGVGALVQPGDFVDVLLSMTDTDGKFPVVIENPAFGPVDGAESPVVQLDDFLNNTTVKVLVQNVQVLGLLEPPADADGNNVVDPVTGQPVVGRMVVILSVSPQQVELVRFAQLDGNLSLVMRSPDDRDAPAAETSGVTLRVLIDQYGVLPPRAVVTQFP